MSGIVVVDELSNARDELFASIVHRLIKLPVRVLKHEIAVELVCLLQKKLNVVLLGVS